MSNQRYELCCKCDQPTGRAGAGDDSIYTDEGDGPYCLECWRGLPVKDYDPTPWEIGDTTGDRTDELHRMSEARKLK